AQSNATLVAGNDSYTMMQESTLIVTAPGPLANDTDADGNPLTAVMYSLASTGTVTGNNDGSLTYTPPTTDFIGVATFTYSAYNGMSLSTPATVTFNVIANRPPNASADTVMNVPVRGKLRGAYEPVLINVLANDSDPDEKIDPANRIAPETLKIVSEPGNGGEVSVNKVTGVISYTPKVNFRGTESFTYKVKDTRGATSSTVRVQVKVN
ncbi:MAG: Ig-like domain-containing protein, partial [Gallionella sp.]